MTTSTIDPLRPRRLVAAVLLVLGTAVARPADLGAQSVLDLLRSIQQGGGWVAIPVEGGEGSLVTRAVPTAGMTLNGCVRVYPGMSGRWELQARDALGDGHIEASVRGGEAVPFSYQTGQRGQLQVDARWSEPRDTTLLLWIGLGRTDGSGRDPCEPVYGGGNDRPRPAEGTLPRP